MTVWLMRGHVLRFSFSDAFRLDTTLNFQRKLLMQGSFRESMPPKKQDVLPEHPRSTASWYFDSKAETNDTNYPQLLRLLTSFIRNFHT